MINIKQIIKTIDKTQVAKNNESTFITNFGPKKKTKRSLPKKWTNVYYKAYPRFEQIHLPKPILPNITLKYSLDHRISTRDFSDKPISNKKISALLYYSIGKKKNNEKRFYPSAGARYPLEIYPVVINAKEISKGIYHYHVKTNSLEKILTINSKRVIMKQLDQPWINHSAIIIIVTAVFNRTEDKYGARAIRHIYNEAGHVAQNLYLVSTALGLGCCSVGGYLDGGLNELLDINGIDESVVGIVVIGNKP